MPDGGQFVSVPIARELDTRFGTGGVPVQPIPANGTVTFPAAGVHGVPADADSVVLDINAIGPAAKGFLTVYDADSADPGVATVGLRAGTGTNQQATVAVSADGSVSVTNHSSGTVDVAASVTGYYTGAAPSAAGETYVGVGWASPVANTSTGWNVPQVPIAAGGSLTFQVTGVGGIGAGADTAVLQVNTLNGSAAGYLSAYAAGSSDPAVSALAYDSDTHYRNILYVPLSADGKATLTNHGTAPVDVSVYARGYYLPPSATPAGGKYAPADAQMVFGTATAGTQLAANASATFQVTGTGDIPESGVSGVTEDIVVTNPTATGRLDEGPAGGAQQPVVSFLNGDDAYAGYDNGIVSTLSPGGQETITNGSGGTVSVQVAVTGIFLAPSAPSAPEQVAATTSGTSATVTWAPPTTDGGSPVTGYTITAPPDTASLTVGPGTTRVTLTGLGSALSDTYNVTAVNASGTSESGSYTPQTSVVSGQVLRPKAPGAPVAGVASEHVSIYASDSPASDPTDYTPVLLGTATSDSSGNWSFTVPPYASLPAAAQALADNNGGILNTTAIASATATPTSGPTAGTAYLEQATGFSSAWVGSATPGDPLTEQPASQAMTLVPQGPDDSGFVTPTSTAATWSAQHDYTVTDNNADLNAAPVTDAYGYQEVGMNGTYNPYKAADGTDLTGLAVVPNADDPCTYGVKAKGNRWDQWINVGEAHSYYDASSDLILNKGGSFTIQVALSADGGGGWGVAGTISSSAAYNWSDGTSVLGDHTAKVLQLHEWFRRYTGTLVCLHSGTHSGDFIVPRGVDNPANTAGATRWHGDVSGGDGRQQWLNVEHFNPGYVNWIPKRDTRCVGHGNTLQYSVSFSGPGFSVALATSFSTDVRDCITTFHGGAHRHWEWGFGGNYTSKHARLLYSY